MACLDEIGLAPQAIRRVIITHHHVDHVGGLPEMLKLSGAEVGRHRDDAAVVIEGTIPRPGVLPERTEAMLAAVPAEQRVAAAARMKQMREVAPVGVDLRLVGGEELNRPRRVRADTAQPWATPPGTCASTCPHSHC